MITLVPIGKVAKSVLETLRQPLAEVFGQGTRRDDGIGLPSESRDQRRGQHLGAVLLAELPSPPGPDDKVLGVIDGDIFRDTHFKGWKFCPVCQRKPGKAA